MSAQSGVVCWGAVNGTWTSATALQGDYRTLAMGIDRADFGVDSTVCGVSSTGSLACAGTGGTATTSLSACLPSGQSIDVAAARTFDANYAVVAQGGQPQVLSVGSACARTPPPAAVPALSRIVTVGGHACGITAQGGAAVCWVIPSSGDAGATILPVVADSYVDIATDTSGGGCGITSAGSVRCWDYTGTENVTTWNFAKVLSSQPHHVVQLASDGRGKNLCGLLDDGSALCSQNFAGDVFATFHLDSPVVELAVGDSHVCGIRPDDTVTCVPFGCSPDCTAQIAPPPGFKAAPH